MKKRTGLFPAVLVTVIIWVGNAAAESGSDYVNLFIGTGGHGHTFPGAVVPHGMVQLSPDTRTNEWDACSGYHYSDSSIMGFTHTHLSGTGIGDLGDALFMPFTGEAHLVHGPVRHPDKGYRSRFSHLDESAEPGYYQVRLLDYNVNVELTASEHAGMHRYTFPADSNAGLIIDMGHTIHSRAVPLSELRIINDTEVEGYRRVRGWAQNRHVYFHAVFDTPFTYTFFENGEENGGNWAVGERNLVAVLRFKGEKVRQVQAKVGISSVDYEGARQNLDAEIPDWDFDRVHRAAGQAWEKQLSHIQVKGGSRDIKTIFYTALYHCAVHPSLFTDADGRYRGLDQKIHQAGEHPVYTVFSLWDTFRALHPLMTIIEPERNEDFIHTMLLQYEQGGMLPKWELWGNYTGTMYGYPAVPVIVDAYMKGARGFDVEKAYEAMLKSACYNNGDFLAPNSRIRSRLDDKAKEYNKTLGFIPSDKVGRAVTKGLEYAYDDWCIAQMAGALGKTNDWARFMKRSMQYHNYFDKKTGFMRAKNADGKWVRRFNPVRCGLREYCEGNAWQWTWFVPHDIGGLMYLMGGRAAFLNKLDELFTMDSKVKGHAADVTGRIGQYAHGNEPSHHMAHLFNYAAQPEKTQKYVDQILTTLYHNNSDGLSGNEDCGAMSAWYVLNAMGVYPICPGDPVYSIGRPLFDEVTIPLRNGNTFVVRALNNAPNHPYIESAALNGAPLKTLFFTHRQLMAGGTLELFMTTGGN